jgi:hypothetical protein
MSSNYGATFTQVTTAAGAVFWGGVCCSWSGQYVTAAVNSGVMYYSSNYGATWTANSSSGGWASIACSASGQYQLAPIYGGGIYYSNNYGVSWTQSNAPNANWQTVVCSASGQYQMGTIYGSGIYYSTNYGVTWTLSGAQSANWPFISTSQNGLYTLVCAGSGTGVYLSTLTNIGLVTNGRIGIGITNPESVLTVYGSNTGAIVPTLIGQWKAQHAICATSQFCLKLGAHYTAGVGAYSSIQSTEYYSGTEHPGYLALQPIGGNVGIGTTNPSATLHVNGSIKCGTIASTSFTFTASTGATTIIANSPINGYVGSTVILITVNGVNLSVGTFGGTTVTASAYVAWDYGAPSYANVYGMVATRGDISITSPGYGVNFNVPTVNSNFYITYSVTILRMS